MRPLLFVAIGFAAANALVFLHVFAWLRRLVSGVSDTEFDEAAREGRLKGFRRAWLGRLVRCHACMGFWIGVGISAWWGGLSDEYLQFLGVIGTLAADGLLLSGACFGIWVVLRRLGAGSM